MLRTKNIWKQKFESKSKSTEHIKITKELCQKRHIWASETKPNLLWAVPVTIHKDHYLHTGFKVQHHKKEKISRKIFQILLKAHLPQNMNC